MSHSPPTLRRWKRVEYEKLVSPGLLHGDPVELIGRPAAVGSGPVSEIMTTLLRQTTPGLASGR